MPYLFLFAGILFTISAVRGCNSKLVSLLKNDFTGSNSFIAWLFTILVIGAIGYITPLQPLSRWFMGLVVVVLLLKHGGVWQELNQALGLGVTPGSTAGLINAGWSIPLQQSNTSNLPLISSLGAQSNG